MVTYVCHLKASLHSIVMNLFSWFRFMVYKRQRKQLNLWSAAKITAVKFAALPLSLIRKASKVNWTYQAWDEMQYMSISFYIIFICSVFLFFKVFSLNWLLIHITNHIVVWIAVFISKLIYSLFQYYSKIWNNIGTFFHIFQRCWSSAISWRNQVPWI